MLILAEAREASLLGHRESRLVGDQAVALENLAIGYKAWKRRMHMSLVNTALLAVQTLTGRYPDAPKEMFRAAVNYERLAMGLREEQVEKKEVTVDEDLLNAFKDMQEGKLAPGTITVHGAASSPTSESDK